MTKKIGSKIGMLLALVLLLTGILANTAMAAPLPADEGTLVIHKYLMADLSLAGAPNDGTDNVTIDPSAVLLDDIEFTIKKVKVDWNDGIIGTDPFPLTADEVIAGGASALDGSFATMTVKTGTSTAPGYNGGAAETGVAAATLPQGIYLVEEVTNDLVAAPAAPFLVSVPMTNPSGNGWLDVVHVYPKNEDMSIDKFITEPGEKHETTDKNGSTFTWIIQPSVPTDIADSKKYDIVDVLSQYFEYEGDSTVEVYGMTESGASATETLVPAANYTITHTSGTNTLRVSFTDAGRKYLGSEGYKFLRIYFDCSLTDDAPVNVPIENDGAKIEYTNEFNEDKDYEVPEDKWPEVHTGLIGLIKVDANDDTKFLAGAKFKIATTEANAKAGNYIKGKDGNDLEAVTDASGLASFNGLPYGQTGDEYDEDTASTTYWLVEVEAPAGYNLLDEPVKVTVNFVKDSNDPSIVEYIRQITIKNSNKFVLPKTGGMGTILFTVGGIVLIGLAVILILSSRKKKANIE